MRILILDHRDSFTYMIKDFLLLSGAREVCVVVAGGDLIAERFLRGFSGVVISPGPGHPADSFVALDLIGKCLGVVPILGICLGMQCLALHFGAGVEKLRVPAHASVSIVRHFGSSLFEGFPPGFRACRYHSLGVPLSSLPFAGLEVAAVADDDGAVMAVEAAGAAWGVQFHPESFLSECGLMLFKNFISSLH